MVSSRKSSKDLTSESFLKTPLQYIKGVGPYLSEKLRKKQLNTVEDLLYFFPRDYLDFKLVKNIHDLKGFSVILGEVFQKKVIRRFKKPLYIVTLRTDANQLVSLKYFKLPYRGFLDSIEIGSRIKVSGEVHFYQNQPEFHHPEFLPEDFPSKGVRAVYSEVEGVSRKKISQILKTILDEIESKQINTDWIPESIQKKFNLENKQTSLKHIHFPQNISKLLEYKTPYQQRFIFEEFFKLQVYLCLKKAKVKESQSPPLICKGRFVSLLNQSLPFQLTSSQKKVFEEIRSDLTKRQPMQRLLQGDVGSGKTLVAFQALCHAVESGFQGALMAPTEILAEQLFSKASEFFKSLPIKVTLLTSKIKNKKKVLESLASGECDIGIGTHALIQDPVQFKKQGLVIIDEQHRFGVHQRRKFVEKSPHFLVMTATPIPRTLAMTLYGDLDVSTIEEKPPGRTPVFTRKTQKRKEVFLFLEQEVLKGRQAYVVYPLVEESEKIDLKNAIEQFENLKKSFPLVKWGLVHGRMNADEKSKVMKDFSLNKIQALVSTTVIEVGVDVPNASLMVVEHCERFGLSQLHQLRGRVGRGKNKSYCILVFGKQASKEARLRASIMENFSDGFKIAEEDLKIRGAGEFFGLRQSGPLNFKIANLIRDVEILRQAKRASELLVNQDPDLKNHPLLKQEVNQAAQTRF